MRDNFNYAEVGKLGGLAAAKTNSIRKQNRIEEYNITPKLCKQCQNIICYEKRINDFCSQSCGASFNNFIRGNKSQIILDNCLFCSKDIVKKGQHKYCSKQCMSSFWWKETKNKLLLNGYDNSSGNHIGKKYLIELHGGKCQVCGLSEWNGQPMPLVLDHIDGNAYNDILTNLRIICNNCDALSPTFKSRNKGGGRFERALRYKYEKELVGNLEGFKWKQ